MPAVSKKQFRFMEGIAHGMKPRSGEGPSKSQAAEYVSHNKGSKSYSSLPEEHHEKKAELGYEFGKMLALRSIGY